MLPWQTFIDDSGLAHFRLQRFQLGISAPRLRSIGKADSARLQITVQSLQQMGPANVVNEDTAATDRPPLALHTVAVATNVQPNDARAKGLHQLLSIAGVVAQIGDNQRIAVIAGINLGQSAGARTAIEPLRQLIEFLDAKDSRRIATIASVERSRLPPTSWAINSG